jgi:hypothetical protein
VIIQKKFCALISLLITFSLYPYSATQNGITLSVFDYSKRPHSYFFANLSKDCQITLHDLNYVNSIYPFHFKISNRSEKNYIIRPEQITGIRIDYENIAFSTHSAAHNVSLLTTCFLSIIAIPTGVALGSMAYIHHKNNNCNLAVEKGIIEHIKKCRTMQYNSIWGSVLTGMGLLGCCYSEQKMKIINQERFAWLMNHCLPKEGIIIKPNAQVEFILFLTQETYNQLNMMVSLQQSLADGGLMETFNVSLLS